MRLKVVCARSRLALAAAVAFSSFGDGALHFGAAGLGAAQVRVQVARVQRDQRLPFANMVADLHAHLLHVAHHLARDRGRGARADGAGGFVTRGPVLGGNRRYLAPPPAEFAAGRRGAAGSLPQEVSRRTGMGRNRK